MPKKTSNVKYVDKPNYEHHELAKAYPEMLPAEYAAFLESVKKAKKIINPVVLYEDKIIDGRHRQRVSQDTGYPLPVREFDPKVDGSPEQYVISQNDDRRHESQDAVANRRTERQLRVAEKKRKGKSVRAIAKEEGISPSQVQKDMEANQLYTRCTTETEPETVTGTDGKKYKKKTAEQKKAARDGAAKKRKLKIVRMDDDDTEGQEEAASDDSLHDTRGNPVPPQLHDAFHVAREMGKFAEQFTGWRNKVRGWMKSCPSWEDNGEDALSIIDQLAEHILDTTPAYVCKECKGESASCPECGGRGWITLRQEESVVRE
jgi:hypothetical protein